MVARMYCYDNVGKLDVIGIAHKRDTEASEATLHCSFYVHRRAHHHYASYYVFSTRFFFFVFRETDFVIIPRRQDVRIYRGGDISRCRSVKTV